MIKQLRYFFTLLLLAVASVGWADSYVKVTSTSDITDGTYLIVYESENLAFNGGLETLDATSNTIGVEIDGGVIEASETVNAAAFTINTTEGSLKSASGYYIGVSAFSNGLKQSEKLDYVNAFAIDNDGNAVITVTTSGGDMTLRFNKASDQKRFRYYKTGQQPIQLYKKTGAGTVTKKIATVKIGDTTFNVGETTEVTTDGPALTLATSDASIASVSGTTVTGVAAGEATITATWAENDEFKGGSKEFNVTVSDPNAPGSEANPYTVAQALEIISKLADGAKTPNSVYVKGVISAIDEVSVQHGNATYDIVDEGAQDALTIFRGKYLDNAAFTAADQINVNDVVVVYGQLHKYVKDEAVTPEMAQGNYIVTLEPAVTPVEKKDVTLAFNPEEVTLTEGEAFTAPVLTTDPAGLTVTYSSSNEKVATVDAASGAVTIVGVGTTTITATFAGNDEYNAGSASYPLKVNKAPVVNNDPDAIVFADKDLKLQNGEPYTEPFSNKNNTFTVTFGGGGNNGKYYITGEGIRIYGGGTMTVAAVEGKKLVKIEVTYDGSYKPTSADVVSEPTYDPETGVWTGSAAEVVFTRPDGNGNWRVQKVKVTVEDDNTPPAPEKEAGLAYSAENAKVTINANDNVYPTLSNPNNLSPILFTSSNADVATVDAEGNVELKAAGETTITASFEGNDEYKAGNASYVLTVYEEIVIPLKDAEIAYDVKEFNAYIGDEVNFPVLSNPYSLPVTFNSTHPKYATVDENGFVTLVAPGRTSIEAIFAGDDEYEAKTVSYMLNVMEHPQKGTEVFDLVTDASTLSAGDEFVIVSSYTDASGLTKYFALGDVQNNNNRAAVEIELEADGTVMPHTTAQRITLEGEAGAWNLYVVGDATAENKPTGYLYASSNSSNQLRTEAAVDDKGNADATITITDGIATIKFQREGGRNDLRFNNSSTIFACYADNNNQQQVQIFRKRLEYMNVNISEAGYATLYYSDKNLQVPAGVKAYTVKVAGNAAVVSKEYNVIPAGSAVILQGTPGDHEFAIKIKGDEVDADNMLMGTDEEAMTVAPADGSYKFYKLADGKSHGLGFYFDAEGGAAFMNGAHKAYLAVEASKAVEAYGFNPTGIRSVIANLPEGSEVYTISGVRVDSTNLPAGLYIVNGKKIVVK